MERNSENDTPSMGLTRDSELSVKQIRGRELLPRPLLMKPQTNTPTERDNNKMEFQRIPTRASFITDTSATGNGLRSARSGGCPRSASLSKDRLIGCRGVASATCAAPDAFMPYRDRITTFGTPDVQRWFAFTDPNLIRPKNRTSFGKAASTFASFVGGDSFDISGIIHGDNR